MSNCASLYTALLHRLLFAHQPSSQNTLVPTNALPKASSSTSGVPQKSYCPISLLLSLQLSLSNTPVETKSTHEYDPPQLHIYLSQNQTAQLFQKIAPLPVPYLPNQDSLSILWTPYQMILRFINSMACTLQHHKLIS